MNKVGNTDQPKATESKPAAEHEAKPQATSKAKPDARPEDKSAEKPDAKDDLKTMPMAEGREKAGVA